MSPLVDAAVIGGASIVAYAVLWAIRERGAVEMETIYATSAALLVVVNWHLEGGYDVLDEMAAVATDDNDKPLERIEILKAEVVSDKEALSHMYIAGPKPLSKKTDPLASQSSRR